MEEIDTKLETVTEEEIPDNIHIPTWFRTGSGVAYNRWALDGNDPEHPYWFIWRTYGVDPKRYGIENPMKNKKETICPCCGHEFFIET